MQLLQINEATAAQRRIPIYLVDATDGFTPEVGVVTPTIEVSKNGAAQGAGAGTWTEIGDGLYYYQATAGEVDTLGFLNVRVVKSGVSREFQAVVQVVAWDPYFNFTANLDATVSSRESTVAAAAREAAILAAIATLETEVDAATRQAAVIAAIATLETEADAGTRQTAVLAAIAAVEQESAAAIRQAAVLAAIAPLETDAAAATRVASVLAAIAPLETDASAATRNAAVLAAIALLNDLDSSDVDAAITANAVIVKIRKVLTNRRETNPSTGMLDIYDDADSAVEFSVPIFEDVAATQGYQGAGIDRQDQIV